MLSIHHCDLILNFNLNLNLDDGLWKIRAVILILEEDVNYYVSPSALGHGSVSHH